MVLSHKGNDRVFRVNHWYHNGGGTYGPHCTDWFIGEHAEAVNPVVAFGIGHSERPTVWMPGLSGDAIEKNQKALRGFPVRVQKNYPNLPTLCRWDKDPRPRRPLTGSLALAVAVGMQPEKLFVAGIDFYQHERGEYATAIKPPDYTDTFKQRYLSNSHGNHAFLADLRYIRCALDAFRGKLVCVGSVMKKHFADNYKQWEWIDG